MRFKISDESVNVYGYKVLTSGIQHEDRVPALVSHDLTSFPVGYFTDFVKENGAMYATLVLDDKEEVLKHKLSAGYLTDVSIGFVVEELQTIEGIDVVMQCRLLEVSLVAIGANRNAKRLAIGEVCTLSISQNMNEELEKLRNLSVSQKNTIAELQDKINVLQAEKEAEVNRLTAELHQLKQEHVQRQAEALVEAAVGAGKILASQKETYVKLANADYETTKTLLESLQGYTPIAAQLSKKQEERLAWTFEDWQKKDPKGLAIMREQDKASYEALLQTLKK